VGFACFALATVCASLHLYNPALDTTVLPIGTTKTSTLLNMSIHVLNDQQKECAVGEVGEIYITGTGMSSGYVGDEIIVSLIFSQSSTSPVPQNVFS
jgi:non-ribosomal peptide synthetase component F